MKEELNSHNPQSSSYSYQVGGSLPLFAPSYVRRRADEELFQYLKSGEFCYVLNSRQMGKSSLRVQTMQRLQAEGIACSVIDITSIGTQQITPEQWYASLIGSLVSSFRLSINLRTWWREREDFSYIKRLSDFFETVLLTEISQNIVIFIDEIDSVLGLKFPIDDFFAWIRACYNKRAEQPAYRRLTFALLGVATPADLIADKNRTPFNIGKAIQLNGFELHEAQPLVQGLEGKISYPQQLLAEVLAWTGGQPFLTQKLCNLVVQEEAKSIEDLVKKRVIENWESQDEPEHLKTIKDRLLKNEKRAGRLLGLYQQILQQGEIATDDSPEQMELRLSGLVVKQTGRSEISSSVLRVYNPIYESVFNQDWVEKKLAELRPYNQAITAWIDANCQDDSRLLRGQALQDALVWAAGKSLSDKDYQFLAASQELYKREMQTALEAEKKARELEKLEAEINLEAEKKALEAQRLANEILTKATHKAQRRIRIGSVILGVALIVSGVLGVSAFLQYRKAFISEITAITLSSKVLFDSGEKLDALIAAIKAKRQLQNLGSADRDTQIRSKVVSTLQQSVYWVRERNRLQGHKAQVVSVSFSPDVKTIATASSDKTAKLWSFDGEELKTLIGHKSAVTSVSFSPDGKTIATTSQDKTVKLWSKDGEELKTLTGHKDAVWSVSFSPDGKTIATASRDKTVKLWSFDGEELKTLIGHKSAVTSVSFSPDGKTIATTSEDKTVKLWSKDGEELKTLTGHKDWSYSASFSPDGKTIATSSDDGTIKLWSADGKEVNTLTGHKSAVYSARFSPDGNMIASTSWDKTIKFWSFDGKELETLTGHKSGVYSVSFSPDGKTIATASRDKTVKLWSVNGKELNTLIKPNAIVISLSFSPDGKTIATASNDKTVKLWSVDGKELKSLTELSAMVTNLSFSPDSKTIAIASRDKTVKLWSVSGKELKTLTGHNDTVWSANFSPDGKMIATSSWDGTVKLWSLEGKELRTLTGYKDWVYGVNFSPDGKIIATSSRDRKIKLWSVDGKELKTFIGHRSAIWSISFSPDGKTIATGSLDNTVKLWNKNGKELKTLTGHDDGVYSVLWSPDGKMIASASFDGTVKLWSKNGEEFQTLRHPDAEVKSISFSSDSHTLAASDSARRVILWNLDAVGNLDDLLMRGCNWIRDYLQNNAEVDESDRNLCKDIPAG